MAATLPLAAKMMRGLLGEGISAVGAFDAIARSEQQQIVKKKKKKKTTTTTKKTKNSFAFQKAKKRKIRGK
jgi:hypothetical protein